MFIAFEGIDGAGKSTQARLLVEHLHKKGANAKLTSEPTKTGAIGILLHTELKKNNNLKQPEYIQMLFSADRAWHVNNFINPEIKKGNIVVTDRYIESTIAYGVAEGADKGWLKSLNSRFPIPDITFLLDIDAENSLKRIKSKGNIEIFEQIKTLKKVRAEYLGLAKSGKHYVINADKSEAKVHKEIAAYVDDVLHLI